MRIVKFLISFGHLIKKAIKGSLRGTVMNSRRDVLTYSIRLYPEQEIVERRLRRSEAEGFVKRFNRLMKEEAAYAEMVEERDEPEVSPSPDARE